MFISTKCVFCGMKLFLAMKTECYFLQRCHFVNALKLLSYAQPIAFSVLLLFSSDSNLNRTWHSFSSRKCSARSPSIPLLGILATKHTKNSTVPTTTTSKMLLYNQLLKIVKFPTWKCCHGSFWVRFSLPQWLFWHRKSFPD